MENSLSIQSVLNNKDKYNLAIPFMESHQMNPFYKLTVVAVYADISETAEHVFKVGRKNTGDDQWIDLYSLRKPFLCKLATEAGIQFAPGGGDVVRIDENTWKASNYGYIRLPDNTIRTSNGFKVIDLVSEEKKYRISYEEKAANGIVDYKAAKDASGKYAGKWINTGRKNDKGYPVKKYLLDESERGRYIEKSLLDAMIQLRSSAPQKAATGALLRVIKDLIGIKGAYTLEELKRPFAVVRTVFSPDYNDPLIKQAMLQQALQSIGNIFGNTSPVVQTISIPKIEEEDVDSDIVQVSDAEEKTDSKENGVPDDANREMDFYCDKCGGRIEERVWDYSVKKFERPLCYKCQRIMRGGGKR